MEISSEIVPVYRSPCSGGEFKHIEANDVGVFNNIVTIQSTDKGFSSSDCGTWTKQSPVPTATPEPTLESGQQRYFHIAVSESGVFVADVLRRQVRVYSIGGTLLQEWDSEVLGTEEISGIAVLENTIYLTDKFNHRVMMFTTNGTYRGQWGSEGTAEGQFREPSAIAAVGPWVFVVDTGNNRVQKFNVGGVFFSEWGIEGSGEGQFRSPTDIDVHGSVVYVVDEGNSRIQRFNAGGTFLGSWSINR